MSACEVAERFWRAEPCRLRERDRVVVEGSAVSYLLWGHEIARWDRDAGVLYVDDCGWRTWLTKDRLNNILGEVGWGIYGDGGRWFIHHSRTDKSCYWEGQHRIFLQTGAIAPARLRVRRPDISERLKAYYEKARKAAEAKRRTLVARTLDGTAYIFVDELYGRRVQTLVVKTRSPMFEAWSGRLSNSTVYSAFARNNPSIILAQLNNGLEKVEGDSRKTKLEYVLATLREMGLKPEALPEDLASSLALAQLIEG